MAHISKSLSAIALTAAIAFATSGRADQLDKYTKPHEPFTAYGMQVRMSITNPINKAWQQTYQSTVFQEIAPCRLTSTVAAEKYDALWGGPTFRANESRHYPSRGDLATATFVNPCSQTIPYNALGIVGRFTVTPGDGDGEVHVDPLDAASANATTVLNFRKGEVLMFEAGVMFAADGSFSVATWNAGADVTIDVLGYLLPDPAPTAGAKGDKGDTGDTGATGAKGDKGDTGAVGPKGDAGVAGAKGDKGDTGVAGPKGDKGDKGDNGVAGPKGDHGDKGDNGNGGQKGDHGDKGDKGDKGEVGAQGPAGPKGDKGDTGAQGPQGPIGPQGPRGLDGIAGHDGHDGTCSLTVIKGTACYPPGNNAENPVTVYDASVKPNSIVILNYTDAGSNGNAQAIISQGNGSFRTTGSPNRCFQYVVINNSAQ